MLKKLVKYGNSNALILDKPILELLNIAEGSIVKIKTDGKSIIISPNVRENNESYISPTITFEDSLHEATAQEMAENIYKDLEPERKAEKIHSFKEIHKRYITVQKKLNENAGYLQELKALYANYPNDSRNPQLIEKYEQLRNKYAPEITALEKGLSSQAPLALHSDVPYDDREMKAQFSDFFKKHSSVMEKLTKLFENVDYQHELILLSERYADNKSSQEYLTALTELKYKYIPEFRKIDEEMQAIAAQYNKNESR